MTVAENRKKNIRKIRREERNSTTFTHKITLDLPQQKYIYVVVKSVTRKNDPGVNKEQEGKSPSAHHTIRGRLVCICPTGAHSQEILLFIL
jgi:hypothetical protein